LSTYKCLWRFIVVKSKGARSSEVYLCGCLQDRQIFLRQAELLGGVEIYGKKEEKQKGICLA